MNTALGTFWGFGSPNGLTNGHMLRCPPRFRPKRDVHLLYHRQETPKHLQATVLTAPSVYIAEQRTTPVIDTHQWSSSNLSLLNRMPCLPAYQPGLRTNLVYLGNVVYLPTCLRASMVYMPTCQKRTNFSFLCANVSCGMPLFYLGVPRCQ